MSGKKKRQQFEEIRIFSNVIEVPFNEVLNQDHGLKGRWHELVFNNRNPIVLELGCGKGEYTVGLAERNPDINYLGVDIKGARMWRGAKTALESKLPNVNFLRTRIEFIDSFFGKGEVNCIWITFPDPQPGIRREKKRLTSPGFIEKYRRFLATGGVIHLKTDSRNLFEYSKEIALRENLEILVSTSDLYKDIQNLNLIDEEREILGIPTFYEKMFTEKGHTICYIKMRNAA